LADGADLLVTFLNFEPPAANVAEYYDIPLATLHISPVRANGQYLPFLPPSLGRYALGLFEWANWRGVKKYDDAQRRQLGLPKAKGPAPRRITEAGSLEIQAYDEVCFPGLADEWAHWDGRRPLVGALTMALPTETDDEVASWIAAGPPPICFGFGSMPVESAADTMAMISGACAQLGQRALLCAGASDFSHVPEVENVKVVGTMNYPAAFPACRAVVHHGGAGTTAASLRAGVPTLILST
ncbi:glycosyltransferase, partial [Mycobacterium kyorinense]|uniref:glycosyltransferase n=1 Tax=Mycobacterium kyorinense TaxID=487514 RepID=UPI002F91765D